MGDTHLAGAMVAMSRRPHEPPPSSRPVYGTVINAARELAAQKMGATEIRARLKTRFKPPAVSRAIIRLRAQGMLPPREKRRPNLFVIELCPSAAAKIVAAASADCVPPARIAKRLLERAARGMPEIET